MNAKQLSKRLETVASFVPPGAAVADIGSDHAYLPCFLVSADKAEKAIAGEVVKGPYESALKQVREEGLEDRVTVRLADGLFAIEPSDGVDTVTIAGMGGALIRTILEKGAARLSGVETLILQPNIHAVTIREWAEENGWHIDEEAILDENGKIYEILVLKRGAQQPLSPAEKLFGPVLLKNRNETFFKKWENELVQWRRILESMEKAEETEELKGRRGELENKISMAEGVLNDEDTERL
ncbi:tRNA (adenine(22)-N(1))-methyltransferase [Indiicoccus explosivorum]|uniref:tRNA (adenine(22)-N(1))-methyltransferase n=1 Tax=Indiicoccus explosivorum TaxID=1917864 RepID=UPI000B436C04|nr:tRNA (adenine(22)-N(1))-methyltransferase TrmK [Indiicoccus explosivorum]